MLLLLLSDLDFRYGGDGGGEGGGDGGGGGMRRDGGVEWGQVAVRDDIFRPQLL